MMNYRQYTPAPALQPYIAAYWMIEGHCPRMETVNILPDGCVDLLLNLREAVRTNHNGWVIGQEQPYLVGTFLQMKVNYIQGDIQMMGIRFKPSGFPCFYQQDAMHRLANEIIEFEPSLFPDLRKLLKSTVEYLDRFFLQRLNPPRYSLQPLLAEVHQCKGQTQVSALCKKYFVSERQLERYFKEHIGCTPKAYLKLARFQHAFALIQNNPGGKSLMDIAFEAGYYDHAHLANDIRNYTLAAPSLLDLSPLSQIVTEGKLQSLLS